MLVYGGEKDVENFDRGVRHGFGLRGNPQPALTEEILRPSSQFTLGPGGASGLGVRCASGWGCSGLKGCETLRARALRAEGH